MNMCHGVDEKTPHLFDPKTGRLLPPVFNPSSPGRCDRRAHDQDHNSRQGMDYQQCEDHSGITEFRQCSERFLQFKEAVIGDYPLAITVL